MSTVRNTPKTVAEVCLKLDSFPVLSSKDLLKTALEQMTNKRLGVACIVSPNGKLAGVFTDGDIRRHLLTVQRPFSALFADDVIDHAQTDPVTIRDNANLREAIDLMGQKRSWDLPVVDADGHLIGLLHLHPLLDIVLDAAN